MMQANEQPAPAGISNTGSNPQALAQSSDQSGPFEGSNYQNLGAPSQSNQQSGQAGIGNAGFTSPPPSQRIERPGSAESRSGDPILPNAGQVAGHFGPIGTGNNGFNPQAPPPSDGLYRALLQAQNLTDGATTIARLQGQLFRPTPGNQQVHGGRSMIPSKEFMALFQEAAAACRPPGTIPPTPLNIPSWTANTTERNPPDGNCIRLQMQQLVLQQLAAVAQYQRGGAALTDPRVWCLNGTDEERPPQCLQQR